MPLSVHVHKGLLGLESGRAVVNLADIPLELQQILTLLQVHE